MINQTGLDYLNVSLSQGAAALFLWLGILFFRDFGKNLGGRLGGTSALCTAGFLLCAGTVFPANPGFSDYLGVFPCIMVLPFAWLFCLSLLMDQFVTRAWHWLVVLSIGAVSYMYLVALANGHQAASGLFVTVTGLKLAIVTHLAFVSWHDLANDLVHSRRQFRAVIIALTTVTGAIVLMAELYFQNGGFNIYLQTLQTMTLVLVAVFCLWKISAKQDLLLQFDAGFPHSTGSPELSPLDRHDIDALNALVAAGMFVEPRLTVTKLSSRLNIPEYRLRKLINQYLGYRNFGDFLNSHRIKMACSRLADETERNTPIFTIATSVGFQSLAPFNRAFQAYENTTPTEYRNSKLSGK